MTMTADVIRVVFGGATGYVGRALVPSILVRPDFKLVGALGRTGAGMDIGTALGLERAGVRITDDIQAALAGNPHVLIDSDNGGSHAIRNAGVAGSVVGAGTCPQHPNAGHGRPPRSLLRPSWRADHHTNGDLLSDRFHWPDAESSEANLGRTGTSTRASWNVRSRLTLDRTVGVTALLV